jgi:hypothetical protein
MFDYRRAVAAERSVLLPMFIEQIRAHGVLSVNVDEGTRAADLDFLLETVAALILVERRTQLKNAARCLQDKRGSTLSDAAALLAGQGAEPGVAPAMAWLLRRSTAEPGHVDVPPVDYASILHELNARLRHRGTLNVDLTQLADSSYPLYSLADVLAGFVVRERHAHTSLEFDVRVEPSSVTLVTAARELLEDLPDEESAVVWLTELAAR